MATSENKKRSEMLIDPIYQKFSRSIVRTLESTEFYEYFMDSISRAKNEFQFSNRKMEKVVDLSWVDAIEESLEGFQNIITNPRNIIREDEIIVNVANAKKAGPDVVRHLAQHGALVENFDEETGDVRPSRLMQKLREDSTELYENRLVFTVLEHAFHFVQVRHSALVNAMSEEYGAKLKVTSDMENAKELVHFDMFLHIKEKDGILETDEKNREVFDRISRIYRLLGTFMDSQFADQMKKINRIKGNITKTNVLKKHPDYKKIVKLWEFLHKYDDVGYLIKVTEQNPYIDERFQQDIYHNIMFQYIILKGYLEEEEDRQLAQPMKSRRRKLKPKMIRQIIEELTEDYDLPDIEIRKVLIEELTKEQLMMEEEAERLRLVEEQEQRRKAEEERRRQEEERMRQEAEEEEARIRKEKEERERQELLVRMEQEVEDRRRGALLREDIALFEAKLLECQEAREEENEKWKVLLAPQEDFADAAFQIEEAERRKMEEEERMRQRQAEEEARKLRAEEEKREQERLAAEAELARIRREEEEAQIAKDMEVVRIYLEEVLYFQQMLAERQKERQAYEEAQKVAVEQTKMERQLRQAQVGETKRQNKWRI